MGNAFVLAPSAVSQARPQIIYAAVSLNQPTPTTPADPLYVVLPQWDTDQYFAITEWPMCNGGALPQAGDLAVLVVDSTRSTRCVYWQGAYQGGYAGVPLPVADGGTGAVTTAAARTNLGLALPLPIGSGGTGVATESAAQAALGVDHGSLAITIPASTAQSAAAPVSFAATYATAPDVATTLETNALIQGRVQFGSITNTGFSAVAAWMDGGTTHGSNSPILHWIAVGT